MTDVSASQELHAREMGGDVAASLVPTVHLRTENPYASARDMRQVTGELYYFFPRETMWSTSARGFGQIKGAKIANSTMHSQVMIEHIFFLASKIGEGLTLDGSVKQQITWTVVADNKAESYAGFLVRVSYQVEREAVLLQIMGQIQWCEGLLFESLKRGNRKHAAAPGHRRLTHAAYVDMCSWYSSGELADRAAGMQDLTMEENPFHPFSVFSLDRAIRLMKNFQADERFVVPDSYLPGNGMVAFPVGGAATWLLSASQLDVLRINRLHLPHVHRKTISLDNMEFVNFLRGRGVFPQNGEDMDMAKYEEGKKAYMLLASSSDVDGANNLDSFKAGVGKRMAAARVKGEGDEVKTARLLQDARYESICIFLKDLLSQDESADVGDTLHGIAVWKDEHLRTHRNFMMPWKKQTQNLSRFADMQTMESFNNECAWAINTAHQEVASIRKSMMHVYYRSPFQPNVCCVGLASSGKSNAANVNVKLLIDRTVREIGAESAKAKNTPGNKTDLSIEVHEDIKPTTMGVMAMNGHGKAGQTSNTEDEAILKYRLTKGKIRLGYKGVTEGGAHVMIDFESFCNTVMIVAGNFTEHQIPASLATRFNIMQFALRTRTGFSGQEMSMFQKHELASNSDLDGLRKTLIKRAQRNQCLHAIIQLLCWSGVFPMPDLTVPVLIWSKTLTLAGKRGLHNTGDVRHFERLKFLCEVVVVEDAIDRVCDSELSPLDINEPFRPEHLLEFLKHIYGRTEHAAFVLGLLQHQYENPVVLAVEYFFIHTLAKSHIANGQLGKDDPVPSVQADNDYYYHVKFDHSLQSASTWDREKNMKQTELIRRLALHAYKCMDKKSDVDEICHALQSLSALNVEVDSKTRAGEKRSIPALSFSREGDVMIAEHLVKNFDTNRLKTCLREVLSHQETLSKNILYGRNKEGAPHVWQSLKIKPQFNHAVDCVRRLRTNDCCEGQSMRMECSAFFSEQVIASARASAIGVDAAAKDGPSSDGLQARELEKDAFDALFSKTPYKDVNMDLDEWAADRHAKRIGLRYLYDAPPRDAPNWNTSPHSFTKAVMQAYPSEVSGQMELYPAGIPEMNPLACELNVAKKRRDNPEIFSLATDHMFGHLTKRQRLRYAPGGAAAAAAARADSDQEMKDADEDEEEDDGAHHCSDGDVDDEEVEEDDAVAEQHGRVESSVYEAFRVRASAAAVGVHARAAPRFNFGDHAFGANDVTEEELLAIASS